MRPRRIAPLLVLAAGVLVACQGTPSATPMGDASVAAPTRVAPGLAQHWPAGETMPDLATFCGGIKDSKIPGKYVFMISSGNLTGGSFDGKGTWFVFDYSLGTPGPTPTPGVSPSPIKGEPLYLYYGSYTLTKGNQSGCAFIAVTQSGKPLKSEKVNAFGVGTIIADVKYLRLELTSTEGIFSETVTGVTPTTGSGHLTLLTTKGKSYATGTITIVGRLSIPG